MRSSVVWRICPLPETGDTHMAKQRLESNSANRVARRVAPPGSHTTVHAGPRTAVPGSPCGQGGTLSLPQWSLPGAQPVGFNAPGQDHRWSCLPAKFSPSRVVSPSGLSRLVTLGTTASADSCSRTPTISGHRPTVADGIGLQASLSKDVNSCCTTGPFISGVEHGAAPCGACSPTPSTLYGLSVRRLISFDLRLPSHETSRSRSCLGLVLRPN